MVEHSVGAATVPDLEPIPLVLVEGFMGVSSKLYWGPIHLFNRDDEEVPVSGERGSGGNANGPDGSFAAFGEPEKECKPSKRRRRTLFYVHLGSLSSLHDRACELFYQLKGGKVDYGTKHSRAMGHKRYGREYPGLYPQWSSRYPLHFCCHSFGAPTVWYLQQLLYHGYFETEAANSDCDAQWVPSSRSRKSEPSVQVLRDRTERKRDRAFKRRRRTSADWVKSITAIQATYRGSSLTYAVGKAEDEPSKIRPFSLATLLARLIPIYQYLEPSQTIHPVMFDFNLDHWGFTRFRNSSGIDEASPSHSKHNGKHRRSRWSLLHWLAYSPFVETRDNALYDMSVRRMEKLNRNSRVCVKTYYRSYTASMTEADPITKYHRPTRQMHPLNPIWPLSWVMGRFNLSKPEVIWGDSAPRSPVEWEDDQWVDESQQDDQQQYMYENVQEVWIKDDEHGVQTSGVSDRVPVSPSQTRLQSWTGTAYTGISLAIATTLSIVGSLLPGQLWGDERYEKKNAEKASQVSSNHTEVSTNPPLQTCSPSRNNISNRKRQKRGERVENSARFCKKSSPRKTTKLRINIPPPGSTFSISRTHPRIKDNRRRRSSVFARVSNKPKSPTTMEANDLDEQGMSTEPKDVLVRPPTAGPWSPDSWYDNDGMSSVISQRHPGACRRGYCIGCPTTTPILRRHSSQSSILYRAASRLFATTSGSPTSNSPSPLSGVSPLFNQSRILPGIWYTVHLPETSHAGIVPHFPTLFKYQALRNEISKRAARLSNFTWNWWCWYWSWFDPRCWLGLNPAYLTNTSGNDDSLLPPSVRYGNSDSRYERVMEDVFAWLAKVDVSCEEEEENLRESPSSRCRRRRSTAGSPHRKMKAHMFHNT